MTKSRHINKPRHSWTEAEQATLRRLYPDQRTSEIAQLLGIDVQLVYACAFRLGLRKSAAFAASDKSGRILKGGKLSQQTQFVPGQKPWNAGKHYVAGGRSVETQFKAGRAAIEARNYLPIGSERLSKDGYLQRKVTDDPSLVPARRWQFVHRLVWEAARGPVPAGHVVAFKPGQFTNVTALLTVERLECLSRADNARRNSLWKRNPELMKLYQLKGAITRQVNRIKESTHAQPPY